MGRLPEGSATTAGRGRVRQRAPRRDPAVERPATVRSCARPRGAATFAAAVERSATVRSTARRGSDSALDGGVREVLGVNARWRPERLSAAFGSSCASGC